MLLLSVNCRKSKASLSSLKHWQIRKSNLLNSIYMKGVSTWFRYQGSLLGDRVQHVDGLREEIVAVVLSEEHLEVLRNLMEVFGVLDPPH